MARFCITYIFINPIRERLPIVAPASLGRVKALFRCPVFRGCLFAGAGVIYGCKHYVPTAPRPGGAAWRVAISA